MLFVFGCHFSPIQNSLSASGSPCGVFSVSYSCTDSLPGVFVWIRDVSSILSNSIF
jgi:hypothetical protein